MTLTLYRPLRLARMTDRLFDQAFSQPASTDGPALPLDVRASGDDYLITAAVPGLHPEDMQIEVLGTQVSISGEWAGPESSGDARWLLQERPYGKFARTLDFPVELDGAKAEASVEHGVLSLRVPKIEAARPKQIKVKAS
jgi:HSP20 family protein